MVLSRRRYLAVAAAAAATGVGRRVPPASARSAADCADLAARVEGLEAELDEYGRPEPPKAALEELHRRIVELHVGLADGAEFPDDVRSKALDVATTLRESVVILDTRIGRGGGSATAWYVADDLLVTNAHNVDPPKDELTCVAYDGTTVDVELLGFDADHDPDVALLRASEPGPPVTVGDSTALSKGDPLVHVGHPAGFGFWVNTIGRYDHRIAGASGDVLYATVPSLKGSSGSPVADLDGRVVGLLFAGTNRGGGDFGDAPRPAASTPRYDLLSPDTWTLLAPVEDALDRAEEWR